MKFISLISLFLLLFSCKKKELSPIEAGEDKPVSINTNSLVIGAQYQGGIIAYILQPGDSLYDPHVMHGLIAAPFDQDTLGIVWEEMSALTITHATGVKIGTGNANTDSIIAHKWPGSFITRAADLCNNLILNSYSDWYLPSADELHKLYTNKSFIGGFSLANTFGQYWSSSEAFNYTRAISVNFFDGSYFDEVKGNACRVRAIRSF